MAENTSPAAYFTQTVPQPNAFVRPRIAATSTDSPPLNAYSVSHQTQRKGQPVRRMNTVGRPTRVDSPWSE